MTLAHRLLALVVVALAVGIGAATWSRGGLAEPPEIHRVDPTREDEPARAEPPAEVSLESVARSGDGRAVSAATTRDAGRGALDGPARITELGGVEPAVEAAPDPDAAALEAAFGGALLVRGRIEIEGAEALSADAHVVASLVHDDDSGAFDGFARAAVSPDGRFACALPEWRSLGPTERERRSIAVRFLASGFTSAQDTFSVSNEPHLPGVEHVRVELYTEPLVAGLAGRVVDEARHPIAGVHVDAILWNPGGGTYDAYTAASGPDGRFAVDAWAPGACTVRASHVEHGSVVRTVELGEERYDLGDFVLRLRGVIAGRLIAGDGSGLPNVEVEARRGDGEGEHRVRTDAGGHFQFADLPRVPHALFLPELEDATGFPHTFVPDATDVLLPVRAPVAAFRIVEPAGLEISDVDWSVVRLGEEPGATRPANESWLNDEGDTLVVALPKPGAYALSAALSRDDTYVAFVPFTVERTAARLDVHLRPTAGTPVTIRVVDGDGGEVARWRAGYRGVERRSEGGWFGPEEPTVPLVPGTWQLLVRPPHDSPWAPVESVLVVEDGAAREHVVRLTELAGRVEFDSPREGAAELMLFIRGPGARGPSSRRAFVAVDGSSSDRWRCIQGFPPGGYSYELRARDGSKREGSFEVRPGEVTRL